MTGEVEDYIKAIPEGRSKRFNTLHELIIRLYPEAEVSMDYKMLTYRHRDGWVALANQKNYISLYTCSYDHIKDFKIRHPAIKTGKGCINFQAKDGLPLRDIEEVVRHAMEFRK